MKNFIEIFLPAIAAFLVSRLFEDPDEMFLLLSIIAYSVVRTATGREKIETQLRKSKIMYVLLGIGFFGGLAGTLINYFRIKKDWLGMIFAGVFAVSFSTIIIIGISLILNYLIKKKNSV